VAGESFGGGLSVGASAADRGHAAIGFDYVALSAEKKGLLFIADQEQGFQVPEEFIGTPVLGKFDGAASEVAVILLQFGFEAAEKRKGVGGGTGKSGKDFVVVEAPDFLGGMFDDGLAERDLSVAG